ncbi:MAG: adenylate/guanylate cyclase domain-containing protein [Nitratireductor sp.]
MNIAENLKQNFLSRPAISSLPLRVRQSIRQREWANEILLRAIQMAVIVMFCIIYAAAPANLAQASFSPVPYFLGAYLVLSVTGLVWGILREPPDWAGYISILFDFILLYGLMVSFHLQYMQPASFIMKAPALLYVFIFIAIRALRFDPKFVILAGVVAALGWAAIVVYVTRVDPGDNMLTRSYVHYLTSNSILIGAEVDKMLSILIVTAVLALAVNGSRNMLVRAVSEQAAASSLSRFFDDAVASGIRSNALALEAGQGEKREATILNVDIRGFTRLAAQLEPAQVMSLLSAYQGRIVPIIQAHGGVIDKFMGDGIMASFGIAGGESDHACRAMAAVQAIFADVDGWPDMEGPISRSEPLRIGMGLATGEVSWGAVGANGRLEMTVIGPAVNLSAKLEKFNKQLESKCIASAETWQLAMAQGYQGNLAVHLRTETVDGVKDAITIAVVAPLLAGEAVVMQDLRFQPSPIPSKRADER